MEIVIPDFDDDDNVPSFSSLNGSKTGFGSTAAFQSPEDPYIHRSNPSSDSVYPAKLGGPSTTPSRPILPKSSASFPVNTELRTPNGSQHDERLERPRFTKLSNGSSSSLVGVGGSIAPQPGFSASAGRKGSLASLRNVFKSSAAANSNAGGAGGSPVPPVPSLEHKFSAPGYPALRNPFSRYDSAPISPTTSSFRAPLTRNKVSSNSTSPGPSAYSYLADRKQSIATNHSSHRSQGGRSTTSQGSSNWKGENDGPIPALPPIPSRAGPSRMGRSGSDASVFGGFGRRNGSFGGGAEDGGDGGTPGEEALRVIFKEFKEVANGKIVRICSRPLNTHPGLPAYLEDHVDDAFDTLITSLAHCGRRHARRVVDLLSTWTRAHCEGIGSSEVRAHLDRSLGLQMRVEDAAAIISARESSAARYVLNRALIELVKVTPKDALGDEIGMSLEQNAFNNYRSEKIEDNNQFPYRKAVSQLQIELLGELSRTRFLTISDRFTRELSQYASTTQPTKEVEARIEHLLRGMRYLKIRVYPEEELEMSSEFIQSLAVFYANAHGQGLKCAYAETLTSLLHPAVETATAEVNHPMWSKAIALILSRTLAMMQKPRYWNVAFPLVVIALGVSPREIFMQNWQTCVDAITLRLKDRDRTTRLIALNSYIRLLWIYLNRCHESATSMRKRLDPMLGLCFNSAAGLYPSDMPLDPFISILHYVTTKELDYGEEFVRDFLRESQSSSSNQATLDIPFPDRASALIRAIGYTLRALEEERPAAWPKSADLAKFDLEGFNLSGDLLPVDMAEKPEVASFMDRCGPAAAKLLFLCDRAIGSLLLSSDAVTISAHASNSMNHVGEQITRKHGDIHVSYATRYEPALRLFAAILDALPRCLAPDVNVTQTANVLCRSTFSADPIVCTAACNAIRRIAQDPNRCLSLATTYGQFIFDTRHVFRDSFVGSRLLESQFERVVSLWVDILELLANHQRAAEVQVRESDIASPIPTMTAHVIEKIEGCAIFLLCSTSLPLRRLAAQILVAARDLEGQVRRPSAAFRYSRINPGKDRLSRVIQIYEADCTDSEVTLMRAQPWTTASDRHRLDLAASKDKKKLLQRIAESDQAKDGALWLSLIPYFVGRLNNELPGIIPELRNIVSSTVLRLQGHVAVVASAVTTRTAPGMRPNTATSSRSSADTSVLADHWRSYMAILCVTMPAQYQMPPSPPIQRNRDAVILTPDTIGSRALFHYLTSLLTWDDPRFKDAAVYALGSISQNILRPVSEILLSGIRRLADGAKASGTSQRKPNVGGPLWTAIAHAFRLISPLILDARSSAHLANLSSMIGFVKATHTLLSDRVVKDDYDLQSLRRSFCIVVENLTNALGKLDSSDRFLGEEMRGAIFKLCYDWCQVGRRPDVAKARESHALLAAADSYKGERDRAQYLDDLQAKTKLLSAAAAEAMAGLCQGKLISAVEATPATQASEHLVEPLTVLRWIRGMFSSSNVAHHETGRQALFALIRFNSNCNKLLDEVLHQSFGESEQFLLDCSFFGVIADLVTDDLVQLPIEQVICLSLSKLGHPILDIRQRAFQLSQSLCVDTEHKIDAARLLPAVGSSAASIYRQAQREIATYLAQMHPSHAAQILNECASRLSQLEAPRRQATLSVLPPWLEVLDLVANPTALTAEEASAEYQALSDLMYLAIRFSDDHLDDIQAIFLAFAGSGQSRNTTVLVKFLFEQGGRRKSPDFVMHAQRILACLAQGDAGDAIFEQICTFVEPSTMAAMPEAEGTTTPSSSLANLDALMSVPSARSHTFSTGQLALLFAGELLPHRMGDVDLPKRLPTLLHIALAHCDHPSSALREQCQSILFQVLRAWICDVSNVPSEDAVAMWTTAEHKTTALARSRNTAFWRAEDVGLPESAFLAPPLMTGFILKILGILLPLQPRIRQQWGELALSWATSCPIRHLACRSFQVFRILSPRASPRMVSDVLARLSSTIASESAEVQSFNQEVLRTFSTIVQNLTTSDMHSYPQVFWCTVACLSTPFETEFTEVIELLSHILDKTNLSDPAVVQHLLSFRPVDWVGPPPYLQSVLLAGLRSSATALMTFDLIRRLASSPHDDLIASPNDRLLHGFLATLPWMLHSADLGEPNEELAMMALDLAAMADTQGNLSFSRLLTSFARVKFRSKDDFIRQAASLLRDYLSTHALDIVTILLGFVLNSHDWMREKSMQMLKLVLQFPEIRAPLAPHGKELLQPLLRLVSTPQSMQALEILDMPLTASLYNSASSYNTDGEIFGVVESTGWSVPLPKELSELTQENVTAVFNTCAVETRAASAHFSVVQFADLRNFSQNPSQTSLDLPSPPMTGTDNASMGDLVGELYSLNEFFANGMNGDDMSATLSPQKTRRGHHEQMPSETMSERRIRAIMSRGRNPSISSPVYDSNPGHAQANGNRPALHRHKTSEISSTGSFDSLPSDDRNTTQRMNGILNGNGNGSSQGRYPARHRGLPSTSSFNSDMIDPDQSENVFGLEEDPNASNASIAVLSAGLGDIGDRSMSTDRGDGHSTPVMSFRRGMRWFGEDEGRTPSPRDHLDGDRVRS